MYNTFFKIIVLLIANILFTKCAQVAPLTGGVRDITPPKLIQAQPNNKALNFNSDVIILKFNEFVQVKNIANQLLISPKLKTDPEINTVGKKITIKLNKSELLPNTTYRFYFGNAIADMHEANALNNFDYVFSTGNFIDTLTLKGTVIEEFNAKYINDMVIGLYTIDFIAQDSLPYNTIPNYVCRTNESGEFIFENLPYKQFKIIAFTDKNKNYLYDGETEKIAFRDSNIVLNSDSLIKLKAFQEEANKTFIKKINSPYYGYSNIILNKRSKINLLALTKTNATNVYFPLNSSDRDTVEIFYKNILDTFKVISNNLSTKKIDTILIIPPKQNKLFKKQLLPKFNIINNKLALNNLLQLSFINIIDTLNTYLLKLKISSKEDSTINTLPLKYKWISPNILQLQATLKQSTNYQLKIDTAAFYSENKLYNDSISINFKTEAKIDFGKLILKMLFNKKQNYIVQLINDKEQVIRETYIQLNLAGSNAKTIDFADVLPATYQVKIIFDDDENKKWTTGNYLQNKQPEKVIIHTKAIKVVSDWEVEEEILIK